MLHFSLFLIFVPSMNFTQLTLLQLTIVAKGTRRIGIGVLIGLVWTGRASEHGRLGASLKGRSPRTEISIERSRAIEHTVHIADECQIPTVQIFIESCCSIEHTKHIADEWHIPTVQILIEAWSWLKHSGHWGHLWNVLVSDALVKGTCRTKHEIHCGHLCHFPTCHFSTKRVASVKHGLHSCCSWDIPTIQVFVKGRLEIELKAVIWNGGYWRWGQQQSKAVVLSVELWNEQLRA